MVMVVLHLVFGQRLIDFGHHHTMSNILFPSALIPYQKEPGAKISRGAKGKKEEKQEAGKEGTAPSENGETKAEEAQKTESVDNEGE